MDTRDEIRKEITDVDNEITLMEMGFSFDEEELKNLKNRKKELEGNFRELAGKELKKIFNAVETLEALAENANENVADNYAKSIENLEKEIAIIKIELENLGLSTDEIQKFENKRTEKTPEEEPKKEENLEEQEVEAEKPAQPEENQEEEIQTDEPEMSKIEEEPEVEEPEMETVEKNRLIRIFKALLERLAKIVGVKEGIAAELAERNIDVEHLTNPELENQAEELAHEEQHPEQEVVQEEMEPQREAEENQPEEEQEQESQVEAQQEEPEQPKSPKETIIGKFKRVLAYRRQIKQIEKNVKKELRKRNREMWIDDKKELAHETYENVKESVVYSRVVQGAKNTKDAVVQGAVDIKEDIGHRFTDKKVWAEQNIEEAKDKAIQGAKTAGTIVLGAGALTVEAMGAAKDALILGGRQMIQNLVMTGKNTANRILDKVQESTQIKEAQVKSMQYDLEMGRE